MWVMGRPTLFAAALVSLAACGTLLTEAPDDGELLDAPFADRTREERAAFLAGDEAFGKSFAISEGLGPIFNNASCAS